MVSLAASHRRFWRIHYKSLLNNERLVGGVYRPPIGLMAATRLTKSGSNS